MWEMMLYWRMEGMRLMYLIRIGMVAGVKRGMERERVWMLVGVSTTRVVNFWRFLNVAMFRDCLVGVALGCS